MYSIFRNNHKPCLVLLFIIFIGYRQNLMFYPNMTFLSQGAIASKLSKSKLSKSKAIAFSGAGSCAFSGADSCGFSGTGSCSFPGTDSCSFILLSCLFLRKQTITFIKTERVTIKQHTAPTLRYNDFSSLSSLCLSSNMDA